MARTSRQPAHTAPRRLGVGAGAGLLAALVMGMAMMTVGAQRGSDWLAPIQVIAATFLGSDAVVGGAGPFALGWLIHLGVGALFGLGFGAVSGRIQSGSILMAAGLAYATVIFLVMTYAVLPWVNPIMAASIDAGWFFFYHLLFGAVLVLALPASRRVATRRARQSYV